MKQIIYLGGKKAMEYDGIDQPDMEDDKYFKDGMGIINIAKFNDDAKAYIAHISTLPVVDVIGDCDWKKGEVKTELVDYEIEWNDAEREYYPNGDYTGVTTSTIKGIVPIPKKQEGESQSDLWRALVCSVQIAAKEADKIDWNNDEEKELFIWEQIANQFTITRKS